MMTTRRSGEALLLLCHLPFDTYLSVPQVRLRGEVHRLVAPRDQKYQSNFVEVRG